MKLNFRIYRQILLTLLGILLVAAFGWVATHSGPLAPIKVTVTKVSKGEITPALFGIGTVEARRDYLIGPTFAGRVRRVLVDVGDTVKAGKLLAEMDPVDLDERVSSTVAAAARARSIVASAEAQVQEVKSRRDLATIEANRYTQLFKKEFVSNSVVDAKLQEQKTAEAQLSGAEAGLNAARKDQSRLEAEREGLKQQRANVRLVAPTDGVITARDAEPGSTVVAGQSVLKLMEPSSLWVKVRFDQARSTGLRTGLPAEIDLRSQRGATLAGKVVRMELLSDSVTEERLAHVAFDQLPDGVAIGELADVKVGLPAIRDVLVIPNASLRLQGTQEGVWLRDNGHLRFAPVKTGSESPDGRVEVLEGLHDGEEVIVYSEQEIKEGSHIEVVASLGGKSK
jgi:HlyD family secretion protein